MTASDRSSRTGNTALWGRATELKQLESLSNEALQGRGRLLCVLGEPGIGKTRLASEWERLASERGFFSAWGRAWEEGGAPPLWPWRQVFRSVLKQSPALSTLALPETLRALLAPPPSAAPLSAPLPECDQESFAWWVGAADLLEAASEQRPLIIFLEDLHSADIASLRLLTFLSKILQGKRLLLVATYRAAEARQREELAPWLSNLERSGTTLYLARLNREAVLAWVRQELGEGHARLEETIVQATSGNPLFVDEMLRLISSQRIEAGTEGPSIAFAIPHGIRQLIENRLSRLGQNTRPVLVAAAILGSQIDGEVLRSVLQRRAQNTLKVDDSLRLLTANEVLSHATAGHYQFTHAVIREVVEQSLSDPERAAWHLAAAQTLSSLSTPPVENIARHYLEAAGPLSEEGTWIPWVLNAATHQLQVMAYDDAIRLLKKAQLALSEPARARWDAPLLLARANALTRSGEHGQAKPLCLRVAKNARANHDIELLANAAVAYGAEFDISLVDETLIALLEEARGALPATAVALRARVLGRLAAALQPAYDPAGPVALAREAISLARSTGDEEVLLAVLHNALAAMMDFSSAKERFALNNEQLKLARRSADKPRELRAHLRLVLDSLELADWSKMRSHMAAFEGLVEALRQKQLTPVVMLLGSMRAAAQGEFSLSSQLVARAEALYAGTDWVLGRWLLLHKVAVARVRERFEESFQLANEIVTEWGSDPVWQLFYSPLMGCLRVRAEQRDDAAYWYQQCVDAPVLFEDVTCSTQLAELAAGVGTTAQRQFWIARMLPRAGFLVSWGLVGAATDGPVDRILALLYAALGDWEAALRFWRSAEAQTRTLGLTPFLARVLYERARELQNRGHPTDAPQIAEDLAEAQRLSEQWELEGLSRLIQNRLSAAPLEVAPPVVPSSPSGTFTLTQEGELWRVSFAGAQVGIQDSRGMRLLQRLVQSPGVELHVLDLASDKESSRADVGDAGEHLDGRARREYRKRLQFLDDEQAKAEALGDGERSARVKQEREALARELSRAFGVGGKARRSGSATERARVAVTRRLRHAIARICEQSPQTGRYLNRAVKTGMFCSYTPDA